MEFVKRGFKGQENHTISESEKVDYWVDYIKTESLREDKVLGAQFLLKPFGKKTLHFSFSWHAS